MAKLRVVISPQAQRSIEDQEDFLLDEAGASVALRFRDALRAALERLAEMPDLGAPRDWVNPRLKSLRMWPIQEFPAHVIYYRAEGDELHVLWVLHGAQDRDGIIGGE